MQCVNPGKSVRNTVMVLVSLKVLRSLKQRLHFKAWHDSSTYFGILVINQLPLVKHFAGVLSRMNKYRQFRKTLLSLSVKVIEQKLSIWKCITLAVKVVLI